MKQVFLLGKKYGIFGFWVTHVSEPGSEIGPDGCHGNVGDARCPSGHRVFSQGLIHGIEVIQE
jgi:hypothetical protein